MNEFKANDRVRLLKSIQWHNPWQKYPTEGRLATVIGIAGTALKPENRSYTILFDSKRPIRNEANFVLTIDGWSFERTVQPDKPSK